MIATSARILSVSCPSTGPGAAVADQSEPVTADLERALAVVADTSRLDPDQLFNNSFTARSACAIAESVYAAAPASEFAMAILPNGARPITLARSFSGTSGSHNGLYSAA